MRFEAAAAPKLPKKKIMTRLAVSVRVSATIHKSEPVSVLFARGTLTS